MSGSETTRPPSDGPWYRLIDPATDAVVGHVTRDGRVRSADPDVVRRIESAFDRELLTRDGAIAEELGVCFANILPVSPRDDAHHDLVFRSLGLLTGLIPGEPGTAPAPEEGWGI